MMKKLPALLLAVAMVTAAYSDDQSEIEAQAKYMQQQVKEKNIAATLDKMPPKLVEKMASMAGANSDDFKKSMLEQSKAAMGAIEVVKATYDMSDVKVEKTSTGRRYAFVPAYTEAKVSGQEMKSPSVLFIFEDEGKWYTITWQPQLAFVIEGIYPDLKGIKTPQ